MHTRCIQMSTTKITPRFFFLSKILCPQKRRPNPQPAPMNHPITNPNLKLVSFSFQNRGNQRVGDPYGTFHAGAHEMGPEGGVPPWACAWVCVRAPWCAAGRAPGCEESITRSGWGDGGIGMRSEGSGMADARLFRDALASK